MNTSEVVSSSTDKKSLRSKKKPLALDRKVTLSVKTRAMIKKELQEIDSESSIAKHRLLFYNLISLLIVIIK